jgi:hypothetical protein
MPDSTFDIQQYIFKDPQPPITVNTIQENQLPTQLPLFLKSTEASTVGVAGAYDKCRLVVLALASGSHVLLVRLGSGNSKSKSQRVTSPGRQALHRLLFESISIRKVGFNADRLTLALFMDHGLRIRNLVDLAVLATNAKGSGPGFLNTIIQALGGWKVLGARGKVAKLFENEKYFASALDLLAMRSWASHHVAVPGEAIAQLEKALAYNTIDFPEPVRGLWNGSSFKA